MASDWEPYFDELADLDPVARSRRLAEIAASDPDLATLLERLLQADGSTATIAEPVLRRDPEFVHRALEADRALTETAGPYRLLELLGAGGMGEVFRAERCDGEFEQEVALKRIRGATESGAIHQRFVRERQILARLDHPGIARLLDGGSDADGRPYFVLELVDGQPITTWCEHHGVSLQERVRLIAEVADAVDAAHRQLVVHRDLKPSNILVDPSGRPRLLDFGIATLLEGDGVGDGLLTHQGHRPFTPAYAAPEQILGEPITTATDVWALGALLFELLTGRLPFPDRRGSLVGLARTVTTEAAPRPSSVTTAPGRSREHTRRLVGDLDAIVLCALERDPHRRYRSAAALADDLRRYLTGLPVVARTPSFTYRASKLVSRHRLAFASAALILFSLIGGFGAALWQAQSARLEARRAETVTSLLIDLFRGSDPSLSLGAEVTARELLAVGASRVSANLSDQPAVRGRVLDAIAQVERRLGQTDLAATHARDALAALSGDREAEAAARVTLAEILVDQWSLDDAERELELAAEAVPRLRHLASRGGPGPLAERWVDASIQTAWHRHHLERAESLLRQSLAELAAQPEPDGFRLARRQLDLALLLCDASRQSEAEPLLRALMPVIETASGDPLEVGSGKYQIGEILGLLGDSAEASSWLAAGLEQLSSTLGPDHPEIALREISLGYLLSQRHELDRASEVLSHAVAVLEPLDHPEVGSAIRYLGFVDLAQHQPERALARFVAAEAQFARHPDQGYLAVAARLSQSLALLEMGQPRQAEALLATVLPELESLEGSSGNSVRTALKYLGRAQRELGDPERALASHERALSIEREIFDTDHHLGVAASKYEIALDLSALGRSTQAVASIADAIATVESIDPDEPRLDDYRAALGRVEAIGSER